MQLPNWLSLFLASDQEPSVEAITSFLNCDKNWSFNRKDYVLRSLVRNHCSRRYPFGPQPGATALPQPAICSQCVPFTNYSRNRLFKSKDGILLVHDWEQQHYHSLLLVHKLFSLPNQKPAVQVWRRHTISPWLGVAALPRPAIGSQFVSFTQSGTGCSSLKTEYY